jgi:hypothetical protein
MEVSGQLHAPDTLSPGKQLLTPTSQKAGWAPELVWTLWRKEIYLVPVRSQTLVVQCVACYSSSLFKSWHATSIFRFRVNVVRVQPYYTSRLQRKLSPDYCEGQRIWDLELIIPYPSDIIIQTCC